MICQAPNFCVVVVGTRIDGVNGGRETPHLCLTEWTGAVSDCVVVEQTGALLERLQGRVINEVIFTGRVSLDFILIYLICGIVAKYCCSCYTSQVPLFVTLAQSSLSGRPIR
jgi:hypothetical protein